jgi:hypothetical protein
MFNSVFKGVVASPNRFSTQYQAVLTYANSQGWGLPPSIQQTVQNNLMVSLVSSNIFSQLDALYILATSGSQEFSTINWINPGSNNMTAVGSPAPTFNLNNGWTAATTTGFMDTNFTFTNAAPQKLRQTSGSVFAWVQASTLGATIVGHDGTAGADELTLRFINQNNQSNRMMTNQNATVNIDFSATGLMTAYSTGVNSMTYYKDNSLLTTQTRTSQGPDTINSVSLFKSGASPNGGNARVAILGFGGNIISSHSSLYTALNTYMTNK